MLRQLQETYGKAYGILLLIAYVFFILLGAIWFISLLVSFGSFNLQSFVLMTVFAVQLFLRKKLMNLILGILTLFFSLWFLLQVGALYTSAQKVADVSTQIFKIGFLLSIISLIFSGILIFSYYQAHKGE